MKNLLLTILVLSATTAFADSWKKLSESTEKAKNAKEFVALKEKYPDLLSFGDPKKVVSASVTSTNWKFTGVNSCAENDLRLLYTGHGMSYCDKQGAATVCSSSTAMPPFGDYDPCQFGKVNSLLGPGWTLIEENHENADTHSSIAYLMEKYAAHFGRYTYSEEISRVSVATFGWYYFGENTCMGDDLRLNPNFYSVEVCKKNGGEEVCEVMEAKKPETDSDPCL